VTDPEPMLAFLRGRASDRKLRLFACACCQRYSYLLVSETLAALEVADRFADGLADPSERKRARAPRGPVSGPHNRPPARPGEGVRGRRAGPPGA
jgi:hypothetical protein